MAKNYLKKYEELSYLNVQLHDRYLNIIESLLNKIPNSTPITCESKLPTNITSENTNSNKILHPVNFVESNLNIQKEFFKDEFNLKINKMVLKTNILVCSTQIPGNGGSATNAYNIHNILTKIGMNSVCVFLEDGITDKEKTIMGFNYNNLPNIFILSRKVENSKKEFNEIMNRIYGGVENIEIAYCKNYSSPYIIHEYLGGSNKCSIVYLIAGSKSFTKYIGYGDKCFYEHKKEIENNVSDDLLISGSEKDSVSICDYINGNSLTCKDSFNLYSNKTQKLKYDNELYTSFITYELLCNMIDKNSLIPQSNRDIDILFAVSDIGRKIKNTEFIETLFLDPRLKKYKKCIIGDYSFKYSNSSHNLICEEQITTTTLFNYMNNSKILLNTSKFDACPNTCLEAISIGCKVICSNNCGGINEIIDQENILLLKHDLWVNRIIHMLENPTEPYIVKKIDIYENIIYDIFKKINKINKINFDHPDIMCNNTFISYNYALCKNFNDNTMASFFKKMNEQNIIYTIPDFLEIKESKYMNQKKKMLIYVDKLKENKKITTSKFLNIVNTQLEIPLVSDIPLKSFSSKLKPIISRVCKNFLISDNNFINELPTETTSIFVYFKKPQIEYYNKLFELIDKKINFIDLSNITQFV